MSHTRIASIPLRVLFIVFFHLTVVVLFAQNKGNGSERILNYHSDIVIDSTGRVQVTEYIKVFANNSSIKRGIVRRIPYYRENVRGEKERINISLLSVLRDGEREQYHTENTDELCVIYIGRKDHILSRGEYEYAITYESYGHVGFFDDYDELYWNVTGNEWDFAIEVASATIRLPEGVDALTAACYTGKKGSTAQDCRYSLSDNVVSFKSKDALSKGKGLTVAVSFPRDIISRTSPSLISSASSTEKHISIKSIRDIFALVSILGLGIYYLFTWIRVGRDPKTHIAIPTFNPPHNWSPSVVRYLYRKEYDSKVFTAVILSMAVKGSVVISPEGKTYTLRSTADTSRLTKEEKQVYDSLFRKRESLPVSDKYHTIFAKAFNKLKRHLTSKWDIKEYFRANGKYVNTATLLVYSIITIYIAMLDMEVVCPVLVCSVFGMVGLMAFASTPKGGLVKKKAFIGIALFFTMPPLIYAFYAVFSLGYVAGLFFLLQLASLLLYIYLIKAPTELGARTQAELDGFRMYLATAEEKRLNLLMPPELTSELFEAMLPYAVALNVENEWSEKFNQVLSKYNYSPEWYNGDLTKFTYSGFAVSLSHSFSVAGINPASSSSSSSSGSSSWSSGSSGGGSSGRGGGGGGGGGW